MMASEQGANVLFHRSIHRKRSTIERLKTVARVAAVGVLISVAYVVCIAALLSSAYDLA